MKKILFSIFSIVLIFMSIFSLISLNLKGTPYVDTESFLDYLKTFPQDSLQDLQETFSDFISLPKTLFDELTPNFPTNPSATDKILAYVESFASIVPQILRYFVSVLDLIIELVSVGFNVVYWLLGIFPYVLSL